jgi:hypothetical protein
MFAAAIIGTIVGFIVGWLARSLLIVIDEHDD